MSLSASDLRSQAREIVIAADVVAVIALCGVLNAPLPIVALLWLMIAFAAFVSPVAVLAATVVTLPWFFHPIAVGSAQFPASELLLAAAASGLGAQYAIALIFGTPSIRKAGLTRIRDTITSRLFVLITALTVVGVLLAIRPFDMAHRADSLREWRWTLAGPMILVGALLLSAGRYRRLIAWAFIVGALAAAAQGLGDYLIGGGVQVEGVRRVAGPFPHPNALALYVARTAVFVAGWWVLDARMRRVLLPVGLILAAAAVATLSRGALLAIGIVGLLILLRAPRMLRVGGYALGGVTTVALLVVARDRMLDLFSGGSGSLRLSIWESALNMIVDRPFRGYGNDQFLYAYLPRYIDPTAWSERFTAHAHNFILDFWIRLGIIGVAFALLAALACTIGAVRVAVATDHEDAIAGAALFGLLAVVIHGLVDNAYFTHDLAMSAWILAWLAFGARSGGEREELFPDARSGSWRSWIHRFSPRRGPAQ
ncbi:MAG: O-antigen ligase family protein [Thermomicrobiales bacterium]|nr:O-antigen ligase family protein [Thermomicrobiales bacterium]